MAMRNSPAAHNKDPLQMYIQMQRSLFSATKPIIIQSMNCDSNGVYTPALKLDIMKAY